MKYQADDGTLHDSEDAAKTRNTNNAQMGGILAIFLFIAAIVPMILAKIVGYLFGLLLKLGIFGKIVTTALMVVIAPTILFILVAFASGLFKELGSMGNTVMMTILFGSALLAPAWYFCWHYDVVKEMGASEFSESLKEFVMFVWFGAIGGMIVTAIVGFSSKSNANIIGGIVSLIATAVGVFYYVISAKPYAKVVKERNKNKNSTWKSIVMLVAAGLVVAMGIASHFQEKANKAKYAAEQKQLEATRANIKEQILTIPDYFTPNLYSDASSTSKVITRLKAGDTVKATGNVTKGVWIPVEAGSNKGYVFAPFLKLGKDEAFNNYPYPVTITSAIGLEEYYGDRRHVDLARGDTVMVLYNNNATYLVDVKNVTYQMSGNDLETMNPKLNADGSLAAYSKVIPKEFDKTMPYQATVTETINVWGFDEYNSRSLFSIPAGTPVTVYNSTGSVNNSRAYVEYKGLKSIEIWWWYLKAN